MSKTIALSLLSAAIIISSPAIASKKFFDQEVSGKWYVTGLTPETADDGNPICVAEYNYGDGSTIHITKDLKDGEFYFWIHNTEWVFREGDDKMQVYINLKNGRQFVKGGGLNWLVQNKNTIVIGNLNAKQFTEAMWQSTFIQIVMPGNLANIGASIPGKVVVTGLDKCIKAYKQSPAATSEKIPDLSAVPAEQNKKTAPTMTPADLAKRAKEQI